MYLFKYKKIFFTFILIHIAGCSTLSKYSILKISKTQREAKLQKLNTFNASGILGIKTPNEASSLHWRWRQNAKHYTITLRGPIGIGTLRIKGSQRNILLETPDGKKVSANNPDKLLYKQTGWHLPITNLHYWIKGIPAPKYLAEKKYDTENRLTSLKQSGWNISYKKYQSTNLLDLPEQIILSSHNIKVKIIIHDWKFR